jgi:hypothetical protein
MFIEIGKYEFDLLRLTYLIYIHTTWVIHKFMSEGFLSIPLRRICVQPSKISEKSKKSE